jgi:hypothetical protein
VSISPTITDVLNGKDPVPDKALELLQAQTRQHASGRFDVVR